MLEIGFILLLILASGFFAATEMAFMTARTTKLRALADQGDKRAELVLASREDSGDFLSMIQVGTTLVATLASAVGGASIVNIVAPMLEPFAGVYAENIALAIIVILITYVTLVIGELVPKKLAIENAETIVLNVIQPVRVLQRALWLPIKLLDVSIRGITYLIGEREPAPDFESAEELAIVVQQAASDGVIDPSEESLINRVFDYGEASLADIMTPRPNIVFLRHTDSVPDARQRSSETGFSRFIIVEEELDRFLGYIHIKDLLAADSNQNALAFVRQMIVLPETLKVPIAFNRLIRDKNHFAVVVDDFGSVSGLVTVEDMLEQIVGEIEDEHSLTPQAIIQESEVEWLVEGATSLFDLRNAIGLELPEISEFNTLAGHFLHELGAIPQKGDSLSHGLFSMTVEQMDGHRISQVRVTKNLH